MADWFMKGASKAHFSLGANEKMAHWIVKGQNCDYWEVFWSSLGNICSSETQGLRKITPLKFGGIGSLVSCNYPKNAPTKLLGEK